MKILEKFILVFEVEGAHNHNHVNSSIFINIAMQASFLSKLFLLFFSCFLLKIEASKKQVSAMYVFGDSTVDPGNNNFINSPFRSNFPPYGRDFVNQKPTGRFTNGKLGTDFIGIPTFFFTFFAC